MEQNQGYGNGQEQYNQNQGYGNGQGQYNQNQVYGNGQGQYDQMQGYAGGQGNYSPASNMNLPYNGNPNSFNPQIPIAQPVQQGQNVQAADGGKGNKADRKRNKGKMKLADPNAKAGKGKGKVLAAVISAVIVAAGIGSYFLFFTPEKRFERALADGQEALSAKDYEAALAAYEKALGLKDDNLPAIKGSLDAYYGAGDMEGFLAEFESCRQVIAGLGQDDKEQNQNLIVDIYMMSELAYPEDMEQRIEALKEGMSVTENNDRLKNKLVDAYLKQAEAFSSEGMNEDAVNVYTLVLELDAANTTALSGQSSCLRNELDALIVAEEFDAATELIDKYSDTVSGVNFTEYRQRIANVQALADAGHALMEDVIAYMSAGRYDDMRELDDSQNASTVYQLMSGNSYIYAQDGFAEDYTGMAAGLYSLDMGGYYFYYGEYENGQRSGQGVYYLLRDVDMNRYELYEGEWANDKPNGQGKLSDVGDVSEGEVLTSVEEGNFTDGYEDGEFTIVLTSDAGYSVTGSWTASMGKAPDIRDQYPDKDFSTVPEGRIVYVVLQNESGESTWYLYMGEQAYLKVRAF